MELVAVFFIGVSVCWYAMQAQRMLRMPSRLQRLLGGVFLWWGLSTLKDLLLYIPGQDTDMMLRHVFFVDGCGAVTFALLLMELTMPGWVTRRRVASMLLPFALFFVLHFFLRGQWFSRLFTLFFVTFAWGFFFVAVWKGRDYARAIRQNYSNLEDVDISWVWGILVTFALCQHVWWAVSDTLNRLEDTLYYIASLVCWYLTMCGINRLRLLRLPVDTVTDGASVARHHTGHLATRLEQLMTDEPLYLNPELTMAGLTRRLNTNRTYLSDCFSNELHTTFYDYVNRLRIERKAIPMMQQEDRPLSLEAIATEAGFKSITTFRRAFRKLTGQLPSEYLQRIRQEECP